MYFFACPFESSVQFIFHIFSHLSYFFFCLNFLSFPCVLAETWPCCTKHARSASDRPHPTLQHAATATVAATVPVIESSVTPETLHAAPLPCCQSTVKSTASRGSALRCAVRRVLRGTARCTAPCGTLEHSHNCTVTSSLDGQHSAEEIQQEPAQETGAQNPSSTPTTPTTPTTPATETPDTRSQTSSPDTPLSPWYIPSHTILSHLISSHTISFHLFLK